MIDDVKNNGRIYTPAHIVNMMLDYAGYVPGEYIKHRHVMDNSCGDGRILCEVVKRYISSYEGDLLVSIEDELKTYIHGIELDEIECERCRENLNGILKSRGISEVEWDIKCGNSLTHREYDGKIDFVFGNPPYVRTRNISKKDTVILHGYGFSAKGMSDLYLAFYELGLGMRTDDGILCYIAPGAWTNSTAGRNMRDYVYESRELAAVIDFEHIQVFENAQTYVMITLFEKRPHSFIRYDRYSEDGLFYPVSALSYDDVFIDGKMYFPNGYGYDEMKLVMNTNEKYVEVKNGYATLADNVFIDNLPDSEHYVIPVLKASTGQWKRCFFPYDEEMNLVSLERIRMEDSDLYEYISRNRDVLENRTYDTRKVKDTWHSMGRSQGLVDTYSDRISLNCILRKPDDLKIVKLKPGEGVYGGLYIKGDIDVRDVGRILKNQKFMDYVKSLRKYKSGGYYTFSSKDVERYINFELKNKFKES